jgi:hypothetical protein
LRKSRCSNGLRPNAVRFLSLVTALAAGGVLVVLPATAQRSPSEPVTAAIAWPSAQRATIPAKLSDGTAYEPGIFLDARTSVGTAPSPDGRSLRLVVRQPDASVRLLRQLRLDENPSFQPLTVAGDVLAWAEGRGTQQVRLWTINLRDGRPARQVTADTGAARFYRSQYDLVVADGRLHWVASGAGDVTEVRSVALSGGPVDVRTERGAWKLSAWPWLVNGVVDSGGASVLRNLATHRDVPVSSTRRAATDCSPTWCRVVALTRDGYTRIDLMRPDGSGRRRIAGRTASVEIVDVAPLDRFEVLTEINSYAELSGNARLLVVEIATRRTVEVSPAASNVSYRAGVLWWSTGTFDAFVRHTLDLRTV